MKPASRPHHAPLTALPLCNTDSVHAEIAYSTGGSDSEFAIVGKTDAAGTFVVGGVHYDAIFSTASSIKGLDNISYSEAVSTNKADDLTVHFTVTAPTTAKISVVGATITGSDTGANKSAVEANDITLAETAASGGGGLSPSLAIGSVSGYNGTATGRFSVTTPATTIQVNKDISIAGNPSAVDTLTLSEVTQRFHKAPEPASIAMLLVGLAGLATARRRLRRG